MKVNIYSTVQSSQKHRIVEAGRDLWRSSHPTPRCCLGLDLVVLSTSKVGDSTPLWATYFSVQPPSQQEARSFSSSRKALLCAPLIHCYWLSSIWCLLSSRDMTSLTSAVTYRATDPSTRMDEWSTALWSKEVTVQWNRKAAIGA